MDELNKERDQVYNDLKSSLGKSEADEQIKQFMAGRYKLRMKEIDKQYGAASSAASKEPTKVKKEKRREEEKVEEINFESGFDHGFASMATFNGKAVGNDDGPRTSISGAAAADAKPSSGDLFGESGGASNKP